MSEAPTLLPAARTYRGRMTDPGRWTLWEPKYGDIILCTPSKSGTTWAQTILVMLLNGGPDLPATVTELSPWIDANIEPAGEVGARLAANPGRRVIKTHTPADGFPVWKGIHFVAVFRHPLDVFLSLRKHAVNLQVDPDHPMRGDVDTVANRFIETPLAQEEIDNDTLEIIARHHAVSVGSGRWRDGCVMHYAAMLADPEASVRRLAAACAIPADARLIGEVTEATSFDAMKANAARVTPYGGTGVFADDAAFFDSGGTEKWRGALDEDTLDRYGARMDALFSAPDRRWIETGQS